jgi:hydrogenase maturation protease
MEGEDIPKFLGQKLSVHQIGLPEMLSAAALMSILPREMHLIGVQPDRLETGLELSDAVSGRFDELVGAVVSKLREWGIALREKENFAASQG